jgi:hypothetical protein
VLLLEICAERKVQIFVIRNQAHLKDESIARSLVTTLQNRQRRVRLERPLVEATAYPKLVDRDCWFAPTKEDWEAVEKERLLLHLSQVLVEQV